MKRLDPKSRKRKWHINLDDRFYYRERDLMVESLIDLISSHLYFQIHPILEDLINEIKNDMRGGVA